MEGRVEGIYITPEPGEPNAVRYADGRVFADGRLIVCVRENPSRERVLAQGWAHRRRRRGLPTRGLQLDGCENFLGHLNLLDLVVPDLDGRLAPEDGYQDLELARVLVDLGDLAGEVR